MSLITPPTSKEDFFELYRNAVTTDKVHVAGQRMLIAKAYLKQFGTKLKDDMLGVSPSAPKRPVATIEKPIKQPKEKKPKLVPEISVARKFELIIKEIRQFDKKFFAQEMRHNEVVELLKKEYALKVSGMEMVAKESDQRIVLLKAQVAHLLKKAEKIAS